MTTWLYYMPAAVKPLPLRAYPSGGCDVQTVGATQLQVLLRAREGTAGNGIVIPASERERLAARRLTLREPALLIGPNVLGSPSIGFTYVYTLTRRGHECWLRAKKEQS